MLARPAPSLYPQIDCSLSPPCSSPSLPILLFLLHPIPSSLLSLFCSPIPAPPSFFFDSILRSSSPPTLLTLVSKSQSQKQNSIIIEQQMFLSSQRRRPRERGFTILDISQQRHQWRWCTFFKPAYFCYRERERDCFESKIRHPKHHISQSKHQVRRPKHQVRHPNRKNTKYADQNTKLFTLFCRKARFVLNLRTFLAYNFQMRWRTKND